MYTGVMYMKFLHRGVNYMHIYVSKKMLLLKVITPSWMMAPKAVPMDLHERFEGS